MTRTKSGNQDTYSQIILLFYYPMGTCAVRDGDAMWRDTGRAVAAIEET